MGSNLSREVMRVLDSCESTMEKPTLKVARQKIALPVDQERRKKYGYSQELFGEDYQTEMGAVSIGPIAFVTVPGEILCEPGLQIKWNSPFPQTWVLYNCNGYASYIAHRRAYTEGGYEGEQGQCLAPEACELVLETAKSLLAKVK